MTLMTPGLTEEDCRRYQELLEFKSQYERESQAPRTDRGEEEGRGAEPQEELRAPPSLSEHEVALIEEELRHLEFKCRNILRAQKMQQLRERCLKAWMMEEETAAAAAASGSRSNTQTSSWSFSSLFLLSRQVGGRKLPFFLHPVPCGNKAHDFNV